MFFNQTAYLSSSTRNNYFEDSMSVLKSNLMDARGIIFSQVDKGLKNCINVEVLPYNRNEIINREYESLVVMVGDEIQKITQSNAKAICRLNELEYLEKNWNENGASAFKHELISLCREIVLKLPVAPRVFPTACNSIQLEFSNRQNDYLELEIFIDHTEVYIEKSGQENERNIEHCNNFIQMLRQVVVDFYE